MDEKLVPLYKRLANLLIAMKNCEASGNTEWKLRHHQQILDLVKQHMPSGSGIDCGTQIDLQASMTNKLVFQTAFHHMDEQGGYDGWTEHTVRVYPSLAFGLQVNVSGRNRNDIKDYLGDMFDIALRQEVPYYVTKE